MEIQRQGDKIIDHDSGNILQEEDFVSMNYWVCNETMFDYLEEYIIKMYPKLHNIEKDEIYLPYAHSVYLFLCIVCVTTPHTSKSITSLIIISG